MRYLTLLAVVLLAGCSSEHERGKNAKDANVAADRPIITRKDKGKPADKAAPAGKDKDKAVPAGKDKAAPADKDKK